MIRSEMKRFDLKHCDSIWKFCDSIWKIAKSRQIATTVTHYFKSKSHVTILFTPLINQPALAPGQPTDKYSSVGLLRLLTKLMVVGRWLTKTPHWAVSAYLLCSYSPSDKHVSCLAASAINDDRRCRSGRDQRFDFMASPASKAFPESRARVARGVQTLHTTLLFWFKR